jgi:DNA-binding response OmpR family regulator
MRAIQRVNHALPGEDLATVSLPEVASWIAIYEELAAVLRTIIERAEPDLDRSSALGENLSWIEERLATWRDRHTSLAGIAIDRKTHSLEYGGSRLRLTRREADLLDFMLRHPGRPFTTRELATLAWHNSRLSDAQVRTYMMRLRKALGTVRLEPLITVMRNRGYSADIARARAGAE